MKAIAQRYTQGEAAGDGYDMRTASVGVKYIYQKLWRKKQGNGIQEAVGVVMHWR
jgi:hypothetical protein